MATDLMNRSLAMINHTLCIQQSKCHINLFLTLKFIVSIRSFVGSILFEEYLNHLRSFSSYVQPSHRFKLHHITFNQIAVIPNIARLNSILSADHSTDEFN